MLGVPVALRREQDAVLAAQRATYDVDVGFLAGLQDAEVGVDGAVVGDQPVGDGPRAAAQALDVPVGAPALVGVEAVLVEVGAAGEVGRVWSG